SRAQAWLALNLVPPAGKQGPLVEREQSEMPRQPIAFGDHEPTAVVLDEAVDPVVAHSQRNAYPRRRRVLLDVGDRLRHLAEQQRPELIGEFLGQVQI